MLAKDAKLVNSSKQKCLIGVKMLSLEEIIKRLQDRKIGAVADSTGLNRVTVSKIKRGEDLENVRYSTIRALSHYLTSEH